jgi:hypothetical protein
MFFSMHILFMATSILGIVAGISVAIFFRKNKNWLKIHKSVNSLSLTGMAAGMIMAFLYVSGSNSKHIDGHHQIFGLAAFLLSLSTMLAGFYQFKAKNKPVMRTVHRWLGRFSLLIISTTIILGLILINII